MKFAMDKILGIINFLGANGAGPSSSSNSQVNGSWLTELLAWLGDAIVKLATVVWGWLITIFYFVVRFCLNLIDILQMFVEKLVGIEMYNQKGGISAVKDLQDTDLIIRFITNETILKTFKTIMVLGLILLIIFSILALVKQNYQAAITDGADGAKKTPREVLKLAGRAIFMCLLVPFLLVFGILGSNAVLASVCNAIKGDNDLTIGGLIFTASAYEANKFREYASDGLKVPITLSTATEVVNPGNYSTIEDMQVLFYKLANGQIYISAISDDQWFINNKSTYSVWTSALTAEDVELDASKLMGNSAFNQFKSDFNTFNNHYFKDGGKTYTLSEFNMFNPIIKSIYHSNWVNNRSLTNLTYNFSSTYTTQREVDFNSRDGKANIAHIIVNSEGYQTHEKFATIELEYYVMADLIDYAIEQNQTFYYVNAANNMIKWSDIVLNPKKPDKKINIEEYNNQYLVARTDSTTGPIYQGMAYTTTAVNNAGSVEALAKNSFGSSANLVAEDAFIVKYYNGLNRLYWSENGATSENDGATYIICTKTEDGFYIPVTQTTTKFKSAFLTDDYGGPIVARGIFQGESLIPKEYCLPTAISEQIVDDQGNELKNINRTSPFALSDSYQQSTNVGTVMSEFCGKLYDFTGGVAFQILEGLFDAGSNAYEKWEDTIQDKLMKKLAEDDVFTTTTANAYNTLHGYAPGDKGFVKEGDRTGNLLINPNIQGFTYGINSENKKIVTFYDYNGRKITAGSIYQEAEDTEFVLQGVGEPGGTRLGQKSYLVLQKSMFGDIVIPWYFNDATSLGQIAKLIAESESLDKNYTFLVAEYTYDNIQIKLNQKVAEGSEPVVDTYRMLLNFNIINLYELNRADSTFTAKTSGEFIVTDNYSMINGYDIMIEKRANLVVSGGEVFYSNGTLFFGKDDARKLYNNFMSDYLQSKLSTSIMGYIDGAVAENNYKKLMEQLNISTRTDFINSLPQSEKDKLAAIETKYSTTLANDIATKQAEIAGLEGQKTTLENELNELKAEWNTIDNDMQRTRLDDSLTEEERGQKLGELSSQLSANENAQTDKVDEIENIKDDIAEKEDELAVLEASYSNKENEINTVLYENGYEETTIAGFMASDFRAGLASLISEYGKSYYTIEETVGVDGLGNPQTNGTIKYYNQNNQEMNGTSVAYVEKNHIQGYTITQRLAVVGGAKNSINPSFVSVVGMNHTTSGKYSISLSAGDKLTNGIFGIIDAIDDTFGTALTQEDVKNRQTWYYDVTYTFSFWEYKNTEGNVVAVLGINIDNVDLKFSGAGQTPNTDPGYLKIKNNGIYSNHMGKYVLTANGVKNYLSCEVDTRTRTANMGSSTQVKLTAGLDETGKSIDTAVASNADLKLMTAPVFKIKSQSEYNNIYTYFSRGNLNWTMLFDFCINLPTISWKPFTLRFVFRCRLGTSYNYSESVIYRLQGGMFYLDYNFRHSTGIGMQNLFRMSAINPFILIFSTVLVLTIIWKTVWGLIRRIYDIVLLFIMLPAVCSTMPMDEGGRFTNWRKELVEQVLAAYSVLITLNLYFVLVPIIKDVTSDLITAGDLPSTITGMFSSISAGVTGFMGMISNFGTKLAGAITSVGSGINSLCGNIGLSNFMLDAELTTAQQAILGHVNSIVYIMFFLVLTTMLNNGKALIEKILELGKLEEGTAGEAIGNLQKVTAKAKNVVSKPIGLAAKGAGALARGAVKMGSKAFGAMMVNNQKMETTGRALNGEPQSSTLRSEVKSDGSPTLADTPQNATNAPAQADVAEQSQIQVPPGQFDDSEALQNQQSSQIPQEHKDYGFQSTGADYAAVDANYSDKSDDDINADIEDLLDMKAGEVSSIRSTGVENGAVNADGSFMSLDQYDGAMREAMNRIEDARKESIKLDEERKRYQAEGTFSGEVKADWDERNNKNNQDKANATADLNKLKVYEGSYNQARQQEAEITEQYDKEIASLESYRDTRKANADAQAELEKDALASGLTTAMYSKLNDLLSERQGLEQMKGEVDSTFSSDEERTAARAEIDSEVKRVDGEIEAIRASASNPESAETATAAESATAAQTADSLSDMSTEQLRKQLDGAKQDVNALKFASEEQRQATIASMQQELDKRESMATAKANAEADYQKLSDELYAIENGISGKTFGSDAEKQAAMDSIQQQMEAKLQEIMDNSSREDLMSDHEKEIQRQIEEHNEFEYSKRDELSGLSNSEHRKMSNNVDEIASRTGMNKDEIWSMTSEQMTDKFKQETEKLKADLDGIMGDASKTDEDKKKAQANFDSVAGAFSAVIASRQQQEAYEAEKTRKIAEAAARKSSSGMTVEQLQAQLDAARKDVGAKRFASEADRQRTIASLEKELQEKQAGEQPKATGTAVTPAGGKKAYVSPTAEVVETDGEVETASPTISTGSSTATTSKKPMSTGKKIAVGAGIAAAAFVAPLPAVVAVAGGVLGAKAVKGVKQTRFGQAVSGKVTSAKNFLGNHPKAKTFAAAAALSLVSPVAGVGYAIAKGVSGRKKKGNQPDSPSPRSGSTRPPKGPSPVDKRLKKDIEETKKKSQAEISRLEATVKQQKAEQKKEAQKTKAQAKADREKARQDTRAALEAQRKALMSGQVKENKFDEIVRKAGAAAGGRYKTYERIMSAKTSVQLGVIGAKLAMMDGADKGKAWLKRQGENAAKFANKGKTFVVKTAQKAGAGVRTAASAVGGAVAKGASAVANSRPVKAVASAGKAVGTAVKTGATAVASTTKAAATKVADTAKAGATAVADAAKAGARVVADTARKGAQAVSKAKHAVEEKVTTTIGNIEARAETIEDVTRDKIAQKYDSKKK